MKKHYHSPSSYIAPKWVDKLKPGDKILTGYPVSPYLRKREMKEATISRVIFRAMTASRVAVILEEFGDSKVLDIVWISQQNRESPHPRLTRFPRAVGKDEWK